MARAVDGDGGDWESGPHCAVGGVRDGNVMTNRPLQFQNYESTERELDELERLIHLYSNKQEYYIALSLAFSAHCYDFGYRNFQHYMKNKLTPLTASQQKLFQSYLAAEDDKGAKFLFDINEIVLTLKEIINIHRTNAAALLKQSIAILTKYSMDARFINNCNKHYLAIKEEMK